MMLIRFHWIFQSRLGRDPLARFRIGANKLKPYVHLFITWDADNLYRPNWQLLLKGMRASFEYRHRIRSLGEGGAFFPQKNLKAYELPDLRYLGKDTLWKSKPESS